MARIRTTKKLAQGIDLNYFKRPTPYKRARKLLSAVLPLLALVWVAWWGFTRDSRVYSSGRMSAAHAVLERQCAACHLQKAGEFSAKAADAACLACHDGPAHHENQVKAAVPECATCHVEHRGRINIRAASNQSCAECHGDLKATGGRTQFAAHVRSLEDGHPEFAAVRGGAKDPGTVQLNHAIHMKPIRRGPNGPLVQLECDDCHRTSGLIAPWPYEDRTYVFAETTYSQEMKSAPLQNVRWGPKPPTGREQMSPVQFARACAGCHLLTFDKRFNEGVPHDKTEVVHAFLVKKFQQYIAAHPGELRVERDPKRDLTEKALQPDVRILTPAGWVAERTADAEELLWRKTCKQCHALLTDAELNRRRMRILNRAGKELTATNSLPEIAESHTIQIWLPHAKFDHDAHRGFSCAGCHAKALRSKETSDILVPGIENCKTCHAPGAEHAESRCFECHTYHDWSKRKEAKPTFTLPELRTGGR